MESQSPAATVAHPHLYALKRPHWNKLAHFSIMHVKSLNIYCNQVCIK